MRIQEALRKVRGLGFSTDKDRRDGTWYISKPYHRASYLTERGGLWYVGYRNPFGTDGYWLLDELEP